jgi:hypothetical protein
MLLLGRGLAACGGKDSPTGPSTRNAGLYEHNAQFNDGATVRWAPLPVRVFLNGIARADEVVAWTQATGGAVTFTFVGSAAQAEVSFRYGLGTDICGLAEIGYTDQGAITDVDIQVVRDFRGPFCQRTVTHEIGHAIGFLNHTRDGGLMDADGGNGQFTPDVIETIRSLYGLPPGASVAPAEHRVGAGRGARRRMVIVDSTRRCLHLERAWS